MGILDADAPIGPYILDEMLHGQLVKKYFIEAGIPAEQIRDVSATYEVIGGGPMGTKPITTPVKLHSINSILTRILNGIPVVESLAWAKMTTSGQVDSECVFWPDIDTSVVEHAVAFAKQIADPDAHAAYLAKLPGRVVQDIGVVIHHSDPSVHASPIAQVSYDVRLETQEQLSVPSTADKMGSSLRKHTSTRHFDERGNEFRLPHELAAADMAPSKATVQ
jgi:hypothetical protein